MEAGVLYYLALKVIPMGWLSAVGICQHLLRRLALRSPPNGAGLPPHRETRKDCAQVPGNDRRVTAFFQQYIDNFDAGSVCPAGEGVEAADSTHWQREIHSSWANAGVPRSLKKSVTGHSGTTLGVTVDGIRGGVSLGDDKLFWISSV